MARFLHIIDTINEWTGKFLSVVLLIPLTLLVFGEVVLRYVFNRPTLWGQPSAQFLFGIISVVAGGYALLYGAHVTMDLIYKRFSLRLRAALDLFTYLFFFLFCGAMLWKGWQWGWSSVLANETYGTAMWNPIIYPIKMMVPLGAFLIILQGLAKFIRDLSLLAVGKEYRQKYGQE